MRRRTDDSRKPALGKALRLLFMIGTLIALLAACSSEPVSAPMSQTPDAPARTEAPAWNPNLARQGPGNSIPLHLGYIPEGRGAPVTLRPQAQSDVVVQMQALLISAQNEQDPASDAYEPSFWAWKALLEQAGVPYEHLIATDPQWTPQALADYLVGPDGVGRFQAVLLSTNSLVYYNETTGLWPSAFDSDEWQVLFDYERAYGVRQAALYGTTSKWGTPAEDDYGIDQPYSDGTDLDGVSVVTTPAGREIFTDVDADSLIVLNDTFGYPGVGHADFSTPLILGPGGDIMAARIQTHGRDRVSLFFNTAAWGGIPVAYTQQLGASLLRWALGGVHIGERRNSFQGDIDDYFLEAGRWSVTEHRIIDEEGQGFRLTARDVLGLRDQQASLRSVGGGIAPNLTWSMAFNGMGTEHPGEGPVPSSCVESASATLTYITKCLADDFWWVSHTWDHEYMDYIPRVGKNLTTAEVEQRIVSNDDLATSYGFGASYSRNSLVTGDISGLGWYDPQGPEHDPVAKVDFGLGYASPYFVLATEATGHYYVASNMSTPSHEPDCWACGTYLTLDNNHWIETESLPPAPGVEIFLVPRWPTNLFATVATPEEVVDAYNMVYGANGTDPNHFDHDLSYAEILDVDTNVALGHLLSGSPYPHYFHTPNANEYQAGRSVLFDWTSELLNKYAKLLNEPLLSHMNDASARYVQDRTNFLAGGVTGTWNRTTGKIRIRSANGGPVFLTGASLGSGSQDLAYNGRNISQLQFTAGQVVELDAASTPPAATHIASFAATPANVLEGATAQLAWSVFGAHTDISLRVKDGATLGTDLAAAGTLATAALAADATFELVVTPVSGPTLTQETTVTVTALPPEPVITSFSTTPATIVVGDSSALAWTVTGETTGVTLRVKDGAEVANNLTAAGTRTVSPTATTTYELAVSWVGGTVTAEQVVVVTPLVTFSATPTDVVGGNSSTLAWVVTGGFTGATLRVQGGTVIESSVAASGSHSVSPTETTVYELVVTYSGGEPLVNAATVSVSAAPVEPVINFTATPAAIIDGQSSLLAWQVSGTVDSVGLRVVGEALEAGLGSSGTRSVSPTTTTTYELVASWAGGADIVSQATVSVSPATDPTTFTVTLALSGGGFGVVISSPAGSACIDECKVEFPSGTTLTLVPVALLGATFDGFTGACDGNACSITLNADVTIGARFEFKD